MTWTRGAHTMKGGVEYRNIESDFQFLGSTEITYNSINDFIDNRPTAVRSTLDSPVFTPQQYYLIGFVQDSWRADGSADARPRPALRLLLGGEGEATDSPSRSSSRRTRSAADPGQLLQPRQEQLLAAPVGGVCSSIDRTVLRAGFGLFYGPGQFEDRIQPIENYIERQPRPGVGRARTTASRIRSTHRSSCATCSRSAATPTTTRSSTTSSTACSVSRELPGRDQPDRRLHRQPGQGHVPARRREHARPRHASAVSASVRPDRLQDRRAASTAWSSMATAVQGCGYASYDALQVSATRRFRSGFTGGFQYQYSRNKGTTQGSNEAATTQNTFDYETEYGTNPQDIPHTFNGSLVYLLPGRASGRAAGASAASSTPAAACRSTSPSAVRTTSR